MVDLTYTVHYRSTFDKTFFGSLRKFSEIYKSVIKTKKPRYMIYEQILKTTIVSLLIIVEN